MISDKIARLGPDELSKITHSFGLVILYHILCTVDYILY